MPRLSRRAIRRLRRFGGLLVLVLPALRFVGLDLASRAGRIAALDRPHREAYAASAVGSAVFWMVLLAASARRRGALRHVGAALFVATFVVVSTAVAGFHHLFGIYPSRESMVDAGSWVEAVVAGLPGRAATFAYGASSTLAALVFVWAARRWLKLGPWAHAASLLLVPGVLYACWNAPASYAGVQATSPDVIYANGLRGYADAPLAEWWPRRYVRASRRESRRAVAALSAITPDITNKRNVIFILQESQRADVTCIGFDADCEGANRTSNALTPHRYPFEQMRSMDSSTFISTAVLLAGVDPVVARSTIYSAPIIFDYANAAGYDASYFTSQHLMYGNARMFFVDAPLSHFVSATNLDPEANVLTGADDALLTERFLSELGSLHEPFFAMVHYSNVHVPRLVDAKRAPFQPASDAAADCGTIGYRNNYENAVYLSDVAVGRLIEGVRANDAGARTVIVYTSDHGESMCEHGVPPQHTHSLYDTEVHVPAWIDAPEGMLSKSEHESLAGARTALAWHVDLSATVLDLLGVWDAPMTLPYRKDMPGHPLTRSERTRGPLPMSNMAWVWESVGPSWGLMRGSRKVMATAFRTVDSRYRCFDVLTDPDELDDLAESGACDDVLEEASKVFRGRMPMDIVPMRLHPEWP